MAESIKGGIATQLIAHWHHQAGVYGPANVRLAVPEAHASDLDGVDAASIRALPAIPRGLAGVIRHLRAVHASVRDEAPDLVHAHSAFAGAATRLLKLVGLCAAPIVYCPHGWAFDRTRGAATRILYRLVEAALAPCSAAIVCISKHDYRHGRRTGIARKRLYLIYNGLPTALPEATPAADHGSTGQGTGLRVAFVGRLDRQKGFDVLQAAVARTTRPVQVVCVGDAVLGDSANEPAAQPASQAITFRGWLPPADVASELRRADIAIVPSRWEGFGLVAAEALREGTPVIATRRGGLPEVVAHDATGEIVAEPDPDALAHTLDRLDAPRLARWRQAARRRFDAYFRADCMARRTMAVYAAVTDAADADAADPVPSR